MALTMDSYRAAATMLHKGGNGARARSRTIVLAHLRERSLNIPIIVQGGSAALVKYAAREIQQRAKRRPSCGEHYAQGSLQQLMPGIPRMALALMRRLEALYIARVSAAPLLCQCLVKDTSWSLIMYRYSQRHRRCPTISRLARSTTGRDGLR